MKNKEFQNIVFDHLNNIYSYILSPKEINDLTLKVLELAKRKEEKKKAFYPKRIQS